MTTTVSRRRLRSRAATSILILLASALAVPAAGVVAAPGVMAATGPRITFDVTVADQCWTGHARPVGARIVTRVETPDGQPKGFSRAKVNAQGAYQGCLNSAQTLIGVMPGDVMVARLHGETVRWIVPGLAPVIDRDADTVSGVTVPGSSVHVGVRYGRQDRRRPPFTQQLTVSADAQGRFAADFSGAFDIMASDTADVRVSFAGGSISQQLTALYLGLGRGWAHVNVMTTGLRPISVVLLGRGGVPRSRAEVVSFESFEETGGDFRDAKGRPVYPHPGDRVVVRGPGGGSVRIPEATLGADPATDVVDAGCMPMVPYELRVDALVNGTEKSLYLHGTTAADGTLHVHVAADIRRDDFMELTCRYPSGDDYSLDTEVR